MGGLSIIFFCTILVVEGNFLRGNTEPPEEKVLTATKPAMSCDHFQAARDENPTFDKTPCANGEGVDENGNCNTTQVCDGDGDSHCYVGWKNESGKISIASSGCWLRAESCGNTTECTAYNGSALNGVYFCCCLGNFCSRNFSIVPAPPEEDGEEEMEPDDNRHETWITIVIVIAVVILLVLTTGVWFFLHQRRKAKLSEMDGISVDTPATASTRCTTTSFPTNMETPSPHLLAVKARGRFGKVWRAQLEDKIVAVKTFNLSEKESWQNEQDIFYTPLMNTHPNILKFLTASSRGEGVHSELWLITEFYDRGSLTDFLKSNTVTFIEALRIIETMASGMSFLHEDIQRPGCECKPAIAHRDFKSKNVLLDHNLNAIIADFGLAVKFLPGESPGESHGQVGTLRYMAPEVLEGAINFQRDAFLRIDMYAFGLVMWEITTRCSDLAGCCEYRMPFEEELGTNPSMDTMQEFVVEKKFRPIIKEEWKTNKEVQTLVETMEECWDHDAEARLSAGCVEQRIIGLRRNRQNDLIIQTPHIANLSDGVGYQTTNAMNQINIQMNNLNLEAKNREQPGSGTTPADSTTPEDNNSDIKAQHGLDTSIQPNTLNYIQTQRESYGFHDDDHDSGTFANEDTLSQDGLVTEQLLPSNDQSEMAEVQVNLEDDDSATSLLSSEDTELIV